MNPLLKQLQRGVAYQLSRQGNDVRLLISIRLKKPRQRGDGTAITLIDEEFLLNEKVPLSGYQIRPRLTVKLSAEAPDNLKPKIKQRRHLEKIRRGSPILK